MAAITAIADSIVSALQAAGFDEAERRPIAYAKREECRYRKCVVVPWSIQHGDGDREDYDQTCEIAICIQKEVADPTSNAAVDALIEAVGTLAALWKEGGALFNSVLSGAVHDSGPEYPTGNLYDVQQLLSANLFTSVTLVRYKIES